MFLQSKSHIDRRIYIEIEFWHGATTFNIMTLSITTFSIMTCSITTFSTRTLSIMTLSITIN
jgi:hypothetical protein